MCCNLFECTRSDMSNSVCPVTAYQLQKSVTLLFRPTNRKSASHQVPCEVGDTIAVSLAQIHSFVCHTGRRFEKGVYHPSTSVAKQF